MRLNPDEILDKLGSLSAEYEALGQVLDKFESAYEALHDECLLNIQAQNFDEFGNATVRDALSLAVISKLTKEEKAAFVRAENPLLVDNVLKTRAKMKRIDSLFTKLESQLISHHASAKQEIRLNNYRP